MRSLLVFVVLILTLSEAQAAHLNCQIYENSKPSASFKRAISIASDPDSFNFTNHLDGVDFESDVTWHEKAVTITMKKKTDSLGASRGQIWTDAFEDLFVVRQNKQNWVACWTDVDDGTSYLWTEQRQQFGDDAGLVSDLMNSLIKIGSAPAQTPDDETRINDAICLLVGTLWDNFALKDLELRLVSFEGTNTANRLFPKAYELYKSLAIDTMGLTNFCVDGAIQEDPHPIQFNNRDQVMARFKDTKDLLSSIENYLDQQFPNTPAAIKTFQQLQ